MAANNTVNGKAFEFACLNAVREKLQALGKDVHTEVSPAYNTTLASFEKLEPEQQEKLNMAARTAIKLLFPLEPKLEHGNGALLLSVNADAAAIGEEGDVRDVLCIRHADGWSIGMSCKHNHEALKHPRVTEDKNFGRDWIGYPCSAEFIRDMTPIIEPLKELGDNGVLWRNVENKQEVYYVPILEAYKNEIVRLCAEHEDAPQKFLSYFFGSRDFYKVITKESNETTTIEGFNMNGTLGTACGRIRPMTRVSVLHMPTRLIEARFKEGSQTTIILTFDGGWTVSMRLHNKDKIAKPTSLAWDVQLVGLPTGTYVNTHSWHE